MPLPHLHSILALGIQLIFRLLGFSLELVVVSLVEVHVFRLVYLWSIQLGQRVAHDGGQNVLGLLNRLHNFTFSVGSLIENSLLRHVRSIAPEPLGHRDLKVIFLQRVRHNASGTYREHHVLLDLSQLDPSLRV